MATTTKNITATKKSGQFKTLEDAVKFKNEQLLQVLLKSQAKKK